MKNQTTFHALRTLLTKWNLPLIALLLLPLAQTSCSSGNSRNSQEEKASDEMIANNDFSTVWTTHQDLRIGFLGNDYQRFRIYFTSVKKNAASPTTYDVTGKTLVNGNLCTFTGQILISSVEEYNKAQREKDLKEAQATKNAELIERVKYPTYIIKATYAFAESKTQKDAAELKGTLETYLYLKNNRLLYNDQDLMYSDAFTNNRFTGTWLRYADFERKDCCWGDCRIPNSGDLDVGDGEFVPNPKYLKNGWAHYNEKPTEWWK
jgi:hypothetical protein